MPSLLHFGSTGPEVLEVQKALNLAGKSRFPTLGEDGQFGPKTRGRVVEFQQANRLAPDGLVGNMTRQALKEYLDMVRTLIKQIVPPAGEAAARKRVVDIAQKCYQDLGWRVGVDQAGPINRRIAAHLCADENTRLRQGGVALSAIFAGCGAPGAMKCLTITPDAVQNYRKNPVIRDIDSWCAIFVMYLYRAAGLKISDWNTQKKQHYQVDFDHVASAAKVRPGDMGIHEWNRLNHHFLVVDIKGDTITSVDGNSKPDNEPGYCQTIVRRNKFGLRQIMEGKQSAFVTPKWQKWV